MKKKLPFVVTYTKEMSDKFNKELLESGNCTVNNPKFYGKWNLLVVGSLEYNEKVKIKRADVEREKNTTNKPS
jgi:hypothetical protein